MSITAVPTLTTAGVHVALTGAPEIAADLPKQGERFVPTLAAWSAYYSAERGYIRRSVAFCLAEVQDGPFAILSLSGMFPDPVPEWLPAPPDGWDLSVRIAADRAQIVGTVA